MRRFLYRSPRLTTHLSMDFAIGDRVVAGICRSLSESGIGCTLSHPVPEQADGLLTLYFRDEVFKVGAMVEGPQDSKTRLRFTLAAPQDVARARRFLQLVTEANSRSGLIVLP